MALMRLVLVLVLSIVPLVSQTTAVLRGVVTDDSGALVPGAAVRLSASGAPELTATTSPEGAYAFASVTPGDYQLQASAPGLAMARPQKVAVRPGNQIVNLQLRIAAISEKVNVSDAAGSAVSADPANNASALVLRGDDLDALSDDPVSLEEDLLALAGPAAGPNGGSIFVDGFSGGQIPSKDSIREIRINQNPFSPEYDRLGFGRIEIFTKPGSDKYRGTTFYNFSDAFWNSRNPYSSEKAPFRLKEYGGNFGGPLGKRASFFGDVRRDATDNSSILNGVALDPNTLLAAPFNSFYLVPQRMVRTSGRFDIQLSPNNTFTGRYAFSGVDIPGAGIGSFNLVSRGYDVMTSTHTVQLSLTTVLGASAVNEVRFQYLRSSLHDSVNTLGPALQVLGSFNGGGSTVGNGRDSQSSYEFQEYVSISHGRHTIRFGGRLRGLIDNSVVPQNFNGSFSFNGAAGLVSIEQYRRTLVYASQGYAPAAIRSLGGGASQFTISAGDPAVSAGQFDAGVFAGDDWRVKPNLTVSIGARYEVQTNIHDVRDFAPRIGAAWAPGGVNKKPKTVLRGGFGMFYDRFSLSSTIAAERYDGTRVQQYVVASPDFFPNVPSIASLAGLRAAQIVQRVSGSLRAPYILQSAIGVERQLPGNTTVAITYANSHGLHALRSRDINAPVPGSGLLPYGPSGPVFLMESAGLYNQNQLIVSVNTKVNKNVSLNGSYMANRAMSNTDGLGTFPANQYSLAGEYGPASTDVRHRATLAGSLNSRWNVRVSPLMVLQTGPPFDITSGDDVYGTTLFNSRPGLADLNKPGVIRTAYGPLDPNPSAGETILTRNYGRGPGLIRLNLRVAKTFGFGQAREGSPTQAQVPGGGGGGQNRGNSGVFSGGPGGVLNATPVARRYNFIVSMQAENVLNHNNVGPIIGNITSPLFGRANQPAGARDQGGGGFLESANNRRLELQLRLNF